MREFSNLKNFRALKLSDLESLRALKTIWRRDLYINMFYKVSLPFSSNQAFLLNLQIIVSILVSCESFHISFNQSLFDGFCFNSEVASKKLLTRNLCPLYVENEV